jgi:hypothetical protein
MQEVISGEFNLCATKVLLESLLLGKRLQPRDEGEFARGFSSVNRGTVFRKSVGSKAVVSSILGRQKPFRVG